MTAPLTVPRPGVFVTVEGGEGSGKSGLVAALAARLEAAGRQVTVTREPGHGVVGATIRRLILESDVPLDARTEALLMCADRAQHMVEVVEPALAAGRVVLCDRHADSSVAYQGVARGLGADAVRAVSLFATAGRLPDVTLLLDVDPGVGLARRYGDGDVNRLDREPLEFHAAVRAGFLAAAAGEPGRFAVIPVSEASPGEVLEAAWAALSGRLAGRV